MAQVPKQRGDGKADEMKNFEQLLAARDEFTAWTYVEFKRVDDIYQVQN